MNRIVIALIPFLCTHSPANSAELSPHQRAILEPPARHQTMSTCTDHHLAGAA